MDEDNPEDNKNGLEEPFPHDEEDSRAVSASALVSASVLASAHLDW
jgi:hypothetical protein